MTKLESIELWLWRFRAIKEHDKAATEARDISKEILKLIEEAT